MVVLVRDMAFSIAQVPLSPADIFVSNGQFKQLSAAVE
jgi:hypothetical protein